MNECQHVWMRSGETVKTTPMRDYYKFWDVYYCQHCLKQQYVLVKTVYGYTGAVEYKDGSERRDTVEKGS